MTQHRSIFTLNDLRAAFNGEHPTEINAELYNRAQREGFEMAGYYVPNGMHITLCDADGKIVVDEMVEVFSATNAEIDDMVLMINAGTPAHIASMLARQHAE